MIAAAALCAGCAANGPAPLSTAPTTIEAGGRAIVVAPPEGRCVRAGAAEAAALVLECDGSGPVAGISIGPEPLFDEAGEDVAFAALRQWARGPEGRRSLGMGDGAPLVRLEQARREGAALYLVFEEIEGAPPRRFLRLFTELNGRTAMISVYDMDGAGIADATLEAVATGQLAMLQAANAPEGAPPDGVALIASGSTGRSPPRARP